ncbi:hypothetical protein SAMN06265337_2260 [Hymenobacter gelipurpurascens]|uniref:Uncharacterized protein n=1 Tax=Hymenobacter gelipurpurascens TaxID=89968 RepID=A0A212TQN2_9BACT|nr:hypothetical protein [Hymenobacter gelipurpurascens]SNC68329.1 hypothetical protein SAMN06265337_2260 [Hymenobacter gelipurpurascens]
MLYQLGTSIDFLIILLDFVVVGLLVYLRKPRDTFYKLWAILALVLLVLPLSGFKFLFSSPGTLASSPGLITIRNPEQRMAKLYYLRHYPNEKWQVDWVEYMWSSGKETVLETEGQDGLEVAYKQARKWHYAPIRFDGSYQTSIIFPQDFTAVDTSGHIEEAENRHLLAECITWLSNLLTLCSIGLVGLLLIRGIRRIRPGKLRLWVGGVAVYLRVHIQSPDK